MAIPVEELVNFCVQQKYFVVVQKDDGGVTVSYPKNCIVSPTFDARVDVYRNLSRKIEYANSDGYTNTIKTAGYDNRVLILTDIVIKVKQRGISAKLILPFDGLVPKKGIVGLMSPPKQKVLSEKEQALLKKYQDIINVKANNYSLDDAIKDNIAEGFNSLRFLLEVGGY